MHPLSNDDDDDCFSIQLECSEMSPKAPKVSLALSFNLNQGTESNTPDNFPTEIRYETVSSGARRKINEPGKSYGVSCMILMVTLNHN